MTTKRTYREVVSHEEALQELRRCCGTQFDPELAEAFCRGGKAESSVAICVIFPCVKVPTSRLELLNGEIYLVIVADACTWVLP